MRKIKKLGIIGGMGPLATVELFRKIVIFTRADGDQDHIPIFIDNNPKIPDRTKYILGISKDSPLDSLIAGAKNLEAMGADLLIMPCNTAHYFYKDIVENIDIEFINMIDETAREAAKKYKKLGILSTEGTIKSKIYLRAMDKYNIEALLPEEDEQTYISKSIEMVKKGEIDKIDIGKIERIMASLKDKGSQVYIAGCTEISLLKDRYNLSKSFIDPMDILAKRAIEKLGYEVDLEHS